MLSVALALAIVPSCMAQVDDGADIATEEQPFLGFSNNPNYLMDRLATGSDITVCLRGTDITTSTFNNRKTRIVNAMMKWVSAARNAAISPPPFDASKFIFHNSSTCRETPDVDITWNTTRDYTDGYLLVDIFHGVIRVRLGAEVSEHDMLHEMGHVFGLHDTYWKDHEGCLPGQPVSVLCGRSVPGGVGFLELQSDDINGVQEIYCVANPTASECKRRAEWDGGWCNHAAGRLHVGDFNGDENADLLCHDINDGRIWTVYSNAQGRFGSSFWSRSMGWCFGSNKQLYVGDFNNNGRDDLLCDDKVGGTKTIAWASSTGQFSESNTAQTQTNPGWCSHSTGKLHVGDFDGDGSDDLLCHDFSSGFVWVDYRSDGLNGTDWQFGLNWCKNANDTLRVGNFDADADDDLLCHDTSTGVILIDYAASGKFAGTNTTYDDAFCNGSGNQLFIDDFSGDGRADLLCHNPASGFKKLAFATTNANPRFVGATRQWQMRWCVGLANQVHVGDFDDNGLADFLCHGTQSGYKWQAFQMP
jgi:hypothetical protein